MKSRTDNSIRNVKYAVIGQALYLLFNFVNRKVFVSVLSAEYLGINGLLSNILSMLSLTEMGIGTAILYCLYKPIADNDTDKIKSLMLFYKKIYQLISFAVLFLGLGLTPFLPWLVTEVPDIEHFYLIYVLYVLNSSASYLLVYRRSLIIADQKRYLYTLYHYGGHFTMQAVQVVLLLIYKNFILYLLTMIVFTMLENILISRKCLKLYPYLKDKKVQKLSKEETKDIFKNVRAMFFHKMGDVVVNGTDNILMAKFCGVLTVGLYSNYIMIRGAINAFMTTIFDSISASFGNLNALENEEKKEDTFNTINFLSSWLYGFCSICLFVLYNPFISLWLGKDFLLPETTVLLIVVNFYIAGMRQPLGIVRNASGLFWNDRYKPIFESVVNLVASIWLAKYIGINGILLGTIISTVMVSSWIEVYVIYKHCFHKNMLVYYASYFIRIIVLFVSGVLTRDLCGLLSDSLFGFILKTCICCLVFNIVYFVLYWRSPYFIRVVSILKKKLKR